MHIAKYIPLPSDKEFDFSAIVETEMSEKRRVKRMKYRTKVHELHRQIPTNYEIGVW